MLACSSTGSTRSSLGRSSLAAIDGPSGIHMLRFPKVVLFLALPCVTGALSSSFAQTAAPTGVPARYLKVDAPYAQKLVLEAKAAHPELKKIGLHAVPPGETESAIIANAIPAKIGKVSSPRDLTVVTSGVAAVYPHAEEGGFFDLGLPVADASGRPLGMMVMEIPYTYAGTREQALKLGTKIRDGIAAKILDKQALFRPLQDATPSTPDGHVHP